ncbi:hypothetical protein [Abyssisolibacter fermentans]|uniref:hypothetical protein n=1 Tax=Abyssisolibacter fermentans TaxID=1766203 RepID=UPI00083014C1|nr:hypothetical protein [Abyssisolibacter fermentans]
MSKLLKYEFIKKYKTLLVSMIILGILELICVVFINKSLDKAGLGSLLFFLVGFAGLIFLLVDNINTYKGDLFKKSGYMLFLTPNNGYKILGSKVLTALIENIVGLIIYFLLGVLNLKLLLNLYTDSGIIDLGDFSFNLSIGFNDILNVFFICLLIILVWFNFMLSIYLAMTIYKSVLSNVKHGGLISFVLFLIINYIVSIVYDLFLNVIFDINFYSITNVKSMLHPSLITFGNVGIILFAVTGYLLDKRVNL